MERFVTLFCQEEMLEMFLAQDEVVAGAGANTDGLASGEADQPPEKRPRSSSRYFGVAEALRCNNCGVDGHLLRNCTLPSTSDVACYYCGQKGHIQAHCPLKVGLYMLIS